MNLYETIKNLFLTKNVRNKTDFINTNTILDKENTTITHHPSQKEEDAELFQSYNPFSVMGINLSNSQLDADNTITMWRNYSLYPEAENAIDEITGEAINRDENGEFMKLDLSPIINEYGKSSAEPLVSEVRYAFDKFCLLTDYEENVEEYFQQFYIDGVMNWETVYPKNEKELIEKGIIDCQLLSPIGFRKVKIRNPVTDKDSFMATNKDYINGRDAELLYGNIENKTAEYDSNREYTFYYYDKSSNLNNSNYNANASSDATEDLTTQIIFDEEQIISSNTGKYDPVKKIYFSYMNKTIRSLRSLYMVEDAIIIYRIGHSSAKRAFYVNTKGMKAKNAEQYLKNLMTNYSSKMFYNSSDGSISNYNTTRSIGTENYWFLKNADGTNSVDVVTLDALSSFDITNMADLDYFVKKVRESFGTPTGRMDKANSQTQFSYDSNNSILREEIRFSKMTTGIKRKFINFIYEFIKRDLVARRIIGIDDWYDLKKLIQFRFHGENEFARKAKFALLAQRVQLSDQLMPYITEHKFYSKKWLKTTIWEMTDEEIEEQIEQIEIESIEDTVRVGEQEQEMAGFDQGGGGSDLGHGYSGSFEPLSQEQGDIADDAFPDFESPEEAPAPEETPTEETPAPEELNQSVKPKKSHDDLILETLKKYDSKVNEGNVISISGLKFKKTNGLFVKQETV